MTIAVGCDVVALAEIDESIQAFGERFLRRVFTPGELADSAGAHRTERLAARFAAKEAAIKALAVVDGATVPRQIEVIGSGGPPKMVLHGQMADRAAANGWRSISISLSHSSCHAMAVVVAELE